MNGRRQLVVVFALGMLAIPVGRFLVSDSVTPAIAQDEFLGEVAVHPEQPLADPRAEYLELIQQKVKLLTPEELNQEIQKLRAELVELESAKKMREIVRELEQLIAEHPESRAAERARQMLQDRAPEFSRPGRRPDTFGSDETNGQSYNRPRRTIGAENSESGTDPNEVVRSRSVPVPDSVEPTPDPNIRRPQRK